MQFDVGETTFFTSEFVKNERVTQSDSNQRFITQDTADTFIETVEKAKTVAKNIDKTSPKDLQVTVKELNDQIEHIHTVFELIAIY